MRRQSPEQTERKRHLLTSGVIAQSLMALDLYYNTDVMVDLQQEIVKICKMRHEAELTDDIKLIRLITERALVGIYLDRAFYEKINAYGLLMVSMGLDLF